MVEDMTGNTETDGPEHLPFLVSIKSDNDVRPGETHPPHPNNDTRGTMDIGWAVDFHHYVGNQVDYNVRLHTDKINNNTLYINNDRILTETEFSDNPLHWDPNDRTSNDGDMTTEFGNNVTVVDSYTDDPTIDNFKSDSGKGVFGIKLLKTIGGTLYNAGASFSAELDATNNVFASIQTKSEYNDPADQNIINDLTITSTPDLVTLNGNPLWTTLNLLSSGRNLIFLGFYSNSLQPTVRPVFPGQDPNLAPTDPARALQTGDIYYDTTREDYLYFSENIWKSLSVNSLNDLTDIDLSSAPTSGDLLVFDGATSTWKPFKGATSTFTTADSKTVTVVDGLITDIS